MLLKFYSVKNVIKIVCNFVIFYILFYKKILFTYKIENNIINKRNNESYKLRKNILTIEAYNISIISIVVKPSSALENL